MRIFLATPPQPNLIRRANPQPGVVGLERGVDPRPGMLRGLLPPLGVGYVAAVLEREGHEVMLLDAPAEDLDFEGLVREAVKFKPGLIGLSAMTPMSRYAFKLAETLKASLPDVPIVLGGAHAICYPDESLAQCKALDLIATGEGEVTAVRLAARIAEGKPVSDVPGLAFRNADGTVGRTPPPEPIADLDSLPFPARRHFPVNRYAPEPYENQRLPSTNIIAARGCTWSKCTFCERSGPMKRRYRIQSVDRTLEEIDDLIKNYGLKELVFYDDDLLSNAKWIREFSAKVIERKMDLNWACRAIANGGVKRETLEAARDAGLWALFIGFESGSQRLLDAVEKGTTIEQGLQVSQWCHELGIQMIGSFILGLPGETPEEGQKTIDFAKKLDVDYAAFIPLHPFEGTPLFAQALREGRFVDESYDEKMNQTRYVPRATYVPESYGKREAVEEMVRRAYRQFYLRPEYFWKHLKRLRTVEDARRYWDGFRFVLDLA